MSIKKCPNCGLPVAGLEICPVCGTRVNAKTSGACNASNESRGQELTEEQKRAFSKIRLSAWDICFIAVCNVAVVLALINVILGGVCWCGAPIFAIFTAFFIAFAIGSGSVKKFLTRYRNAVLLLNLIAGLLFAAYRICGKTDFDWSFDYFIPINILIACTVMLVLLSFKSIQVKTIAISSCIILSESILQFFVMVFGIAATSEVSRILAACAFGVNFLTAINLAFLYFIKYRNVIGDKFRFWE